MVKPVPIKPKPIPFPVVDNVDNPHKDNVETERIDMFKLRDIFDK